MKKHFDVTGMTCAACRIHVEKDVQKVPGVEGVNVSLMSNSMVVEYDERKTKPSDIIRAVKKGGYGAKLSVDGNLNEEISDRRMKAFQTRVIVSLAFFGVLLYVSMGSMAGLPVPAFMDPHHHPYVFSLIQLGLTLPILIYNFSYFKSGTLRLWKLSPNMDSLIAVGAGAAFLYGIYVIASPFLSGNAPGMLGDKLYFESAAAILSLVTLGKYFEARSKKSTHGAIAGLIRLAPKTAWVLRDGNESEVPVETLRPGDVIAIRPGMKIPVDGKILEGGSAIDESALTGESMPVDKKAGDSVYTATMNLTGAFRFEATAVGEDTTLSRIIRLVREAADSKAPISKLADKISGIFVPVVFAISLITGLYWGFASRNLDFTLMMSITVLVISCPCALGLATPMAVMVATGKGAEHNILFKSAESLERLHAIDTVVLDKTGTLTYGKPEVKELLLAPGVDQEELLRVAGTLESGSEHPIAKAIVLRTKGIVLDSPEGFTNLPGSGVRANIGGEPHFAGNQALMESQGIDVASVGDSPARLANEGKTVVFFASAKRFLGAIALADAVRPTTKEAIDRFHKAKLAVRMVTGDRAETARSLAAVLGIDHVSAGVLPDGKADIIAELQKEGKKVLMIGDGINDSVALAKADVGMAIGTGTDVAIESADVILTRNDLNDAVTAIELSRKTIRNIKGSLFWAFFYNTVGIPLAAGVFFLSLGWKLNPTLASLAMSFSSVSVVLNALRLKRFHIHKGG